MRANYRTKIWVRSFNLEFAPFGEMGGEPLPDFIGFVIIIVKITRDNDTFFGLSSRPAYLEAFWKTGETALRSL